MLAGWQATVRVARDGSFEQRTVWPFRHRYVPARPLSLRTSACNEYRSAVRKRSLVIKLLGPPEVLVDGEPLRVDTRKALAVLAYLVTTDQPQARAHLAALLWPEADDASARGALRRTLSTLKAALGDTYLVVDRSSARIDRTDVEADVWQLRSDADADIGLAAAVRGEFLAGFALRDAPDFDDWTLAQADAMRQRSIAILDEAAERRSAGGDLVSALELARRRIELDRLDEGGHRQLMMLHARAGDRASALRQYRSCVRVLSEELGVEPLPATTALHDAILAGTAFQPPEPSSPAMKPSEPPPLVGRDAELHRLDEALRSDVTPLVLIEGEAGIGKSRLVAELATMVERDGGHVLELRGFPGNRATPYAPVVEMFERELRAHPQRVAALDGPVRAEVARLVPAVIEGQTRSSPLEGPGAEARFSDALTAALAALAAHAPLVLDDAHWIDPASLGLAAQLARRAVEHHVLVVICRRPVDANDDPLLPAIAEARRANRLLELNLGRLTASDVRRIVERSDVDVDADALHAESAGVPFYLVERLAALAAGAPADEIPAGIRDLVRMRVAACSPAAQQILAAGAVIGGSFDSDLVRNVSGRSTDTVADALDELAAHRLIVARPGGLQIDHELTRSVVLDGLGLGRRRLLHGRAADAFARTGGRRRAAAAIASHLHAAGDEARAAQWYEAAGRQASELHAHVEAIEQFEASLALAAEPDPQLHVRIAERWTLLGRYAEAIAAFGAAAASLPVAEVWRAELGLARAHRRLGNLALANAHLDAASATLGPERSAERTNVLVERALIADREGMDAAAAAHADAALHLVPAHGVSVERAQAHNLAGLLARHRGDLALARHHLTEALGIAANLPAPTARMASLNNLALLDAAEGAAEAAEARLRQALAIAMATVDRHHEAALRNNLADVLNVAGRRSEAVGEVARSASILAELGGFGTSAREPTPEVWRLVDW